MTVKYVLSSLSFVILGRVALHIKEMLKTADLYNNEHHIVTAFNQVTQTTSTNI